MKEITLEELLKAGAHFGHRASRWNPKMAPYIFTTRNKFHIIDLEKTKSKIQKAQDFVSGIAKSGGIVLFVGTKKQARPVVKKYAEAARMPYVTERWLGGTLTNFKTIQKSIKKMAFLEGLLGSERIKNYTKKEQLMMKREYDKSMNLFAGIRNMKCLPDAIFVAAADDEKIAVREARDTGVKVVGVTDTNSDPSQVDFIIPANDDATKTVELITACISGAIATAKVSSTPATDPKDQK